MKKYLLVGFIISVVVQASAATSEIYPKHRKLTGHVGSVLAVEVTNDGKTLVTGSRDDTMKVWDLATGQLKRTLTAHTGDADIYAIAFSHDGRLMASGGRDRTIILWDAVTFEPVRTLRGHTLDIRNLAFSPDDLTLASVAEDKTFRLWDVATGTLKITRADHTGKVKTVTYFPDGSTIATAATDGTVRLWDAKTGELRQTLDGAKDGFEFCDVSPDGKQIFAGTSNIGQLIFWDAKRGGILKDLPTAHGNQLGMELDSGTYSPDGKWAISGSKDRSVKFWDTKSFEARYSISGLPGRVESMHISKDGRTLITGFGGVNYDIMIWDLEDLLR